MSKQLTEGVVGRWQNILIGHLKANRCLHNGLYHISKPQNHPVSSGSNPRPLPPNQFPPLVPLFQFSHDIGG